MCFNSVCCFPCLHFVAREENEGKRVHIFCSIKKMYMQGTHMPLSMVLR